MTDEKRTYQLEFSDQGPMRVTIPATWKITFGAIVPGKAGGQFGVRIWEGADKQRAVFPNAVAIWDISLDIQVAAVRKYGTEDWYSDDDKTWVGANADLVEKDWKPMAEVADGNPPWKPQPEALENDYPSATMPSMTMAKRWR